MAQKDYYLSLGVAKTASDNEIKASYRKLARQYHPDVNKSAEAAQKFKEVSEAYQILSDPNKRQTYDRFGSAAFEPGAGGFGGGGPFGQGNPFGTQGGPFGFGGGGNINIDFEDPFSLFEQFFGSSGLGEMFRRRPTYQMELSFDEAIKGTTKQVEVEKREKNGTIKKDRLNISVPAGVDDGVRMRFGEIEIIFRVRPHPQFQREGPNIFTEVKLTIPQIVLGDIIDVNTVEGVVSLKVPPGTEPGTLIKIKGKGVASLRGGKGDHFVRVRIDVPKHLSVQERQLYEELKSGSAKKKSWF